MTDIILSTIKSTLKKATIEKRHAFRYFTLATSSINGTPRLRTVVLRELTEDLNMMIYTDSRSKKVAHIRSRDQVSMLFFDPERLLQLSITARAEIVRDELVIRRIWERIPPKSRRDYTTQTTPGKEIKNPDHIEYLADKHFFSAIRLIPDHIEYLRLKRPHHIRVSFKKETHDWKGTFLVP